MTRINLVPPEELCDQHLLAEHRELTRIPNSVVRGKFSLEGQPSDYKLGEGHVRFFFDKMGFLFLRYIKLYRECKRRGFNVNYNWPEATAELDNLMWKYYRPTPEAIALNRARIAERIPAKPRFTVCTVR